MDYLLHYPTLYQPMSCVKLPTYHVILIYNTPKRQREREREFYHDHDLSPMIVCYVNAKS